MDQEQAEKDAVDEVLFSEDLPLIQKNKENSRGFKRNMETNHTSSAQIAPIEREQDVTGQVAKDVVLPLELENPT